MGHVRARHPKGNCQAQAPSSRGRGTYSQGPSLPGPPLVQGTPTSLSERYLCKTDTGAPFPGGHSPPQGPAWASGRQAGFHALLVPCATPEKPTTRTSLPTFQNHSAQASPPLHSAGQLFPEGQGPAPPRGWFLYPPPPLPAQGLAKADVMMFADPNPSPSKS